MSVAGISDVAYFPVAKVVVNKQTPSSHKFLRRLYRAPFKGARSADLF